MCECAEELGEGHTKSDDGTAEAFLPPMISFPSGSNLLNVTEKKNP